MINYENFRIFGFTGFEPEFGFCMKLNDKWEEFKCSVEFSINYDNITDYFTLKLDKATVLKYDDEIEQYIKYSLSKDQFKSLEAWMNDVTHLDEYYEYMNSYE